MKDWIEFFTVTYSLLRISFLLLDGKTLTCDMTPVEEKTSGNIPEREFHFSWQHYRVIATFARGVCNIRQRNAVLSRTRVFICDIFLLIVFAHGKMTFLSFPSFVISLFFSLICSTLSSFDCCIGKSFSIEILWSNFFYTDCWW